MSKSAQKPTLAKLAFAVVVLIGAVGTVAFNLGLLDAFLGGEDESVALASEGEFGSDDEWTEDEWVEDEFGGDEGEFDEGFDDEEVLEEPATVAPAPSASPDWSAMFSQLMEREEERAAMLASIEVTPEAAAAAASQETERLRREAEAVEAERLARLAAMTSAQRAAEEIGRFELRGVMSEGGRGVALVNSHLVREGEIVPGTRALVLEIYRDRLVVEHPDLDETLAVHLAPLDISSTAGADAAATESAAPEEPAPAVEVPAPVVSADDG